MPEFQGQQEEKLRELAYELWEKAGSPAGRQDEFWRQAEERLVQDKHQAPHDVVSPQDKLPADAPNDDLDIAGEDSFPASDPVNHT
jgi:Protein of unknown function (DUF2934)